MSAIASQITSLMVVFSTIYSGTDQRKHQSSVSLAFVRGIHWWLNAPHKGSVMQKMFPFDDVIVIWVFFLSLLQSCCMRYCIFTPQPLRAPGYCRRPSGRVGWRAAGQNSPVNTLTSTIFHRSFWNLARTFITLRSQTSLIMEVLPH